MFDRGFLLVLGDFRRRIRASTRHPVSGEAVRGMSNRGTWYEKYVGATDRSVTVGTRCQMSTGREGVNAVRVASVGSPSLNRWMSQVPLPDEIGMY